MKWLVSAAALLSFAVIPLRADESGTVVAHPIFKGFYFCTEHWARQFATPGDALGTDCLVQELTEVDGRVWLRSHKGDGFANEDWYGWRKDVLSPCTGEVLKTTENPVTNRPGVLGQPPASLVLLKCADQVMFMLAHIDQPSVKAGDAVKRGQPIAKVGNNGYSRSPHIHVGAWKGDQPLQIRFDQNAMADFHEPRSLDMRAAEDADKRYFLIGPHVGVEPDKKGLGLVVVLPGGDGGEQARRFVENLFKYGAPRGYLVAQLVAPKWREDQRIVWPTSKVPAEGMKFSTPEFVGSVIADVEARHLLDPGRIFLLAWSSGGPAAYDSTLTQSKVRGAMIAASVFKPELHAPLGGAKSKSYYLLQSSGDEITPFPHAERARDELTKAGAKVLLETYEGGHGAWMGTTFSSVRDAIQWLEGQNSILPKPE